MGLKKGLKGNKRQVYSRPSYHSKHGSVGSEGNPATFGGQSHAFAAAQADERSVGSPVRLPTSGDLG